MFLRLRLRMMLDVIGTQLLNGLSAIGKSFDVLCKVGSERPRKTNPDQDARLFQTVRAKPLTSIQ